MQYFGVPTCPYCRKRVNLIRTWSLKRQGEYQCPRCGGISNIFLSPLIYVFGLLAVFAGGAVYFFHKFILDDISLETVFQVLIPFAVFFLLSLFMVYLAKPVIKKAVRGDEKKRRGRGNFEDRRLAGAETAGRMYYDDQEFIPRMDYRTGPLPAIPGNDDDMKIMPSAPEKRELPQRSRRQELPQPIKRPEPPARRPSEAAVRIAPADPSKPSVPAVSRPVRPVESVRTTERVRPLENVVSAPRIEEPPVRTEPVRKVTSVEIPAVSNEDFFAKYDDPAYVERRLRELKENRGEKS